MEAYKAMKRFAIVVLAMSVHAPALAAAPTLTEQDAVRLVRQFSHLIACDIGPEFNAIQLDAKTSPLNLNLRGPVYLVVWHGDVGCLGGSGTNIPYFSLVNLGVGDNPLVNSQYPQPKLDFRDVRKVYIKNGMLVIEGMGYGPRDGNCCPTKPEISVFQLSYDGFRPL